MITKENLKDFLMSISPETISEVLESEKDYVLMEAHIFNVGGFATLQAVDYDPEIEFEAGERGDLFCCKEDFEQLLDETEALEY